MGLPVLLLGELVRRLLGQLARLRQRVVSVANLDEDAAPDQPTSSQGPTRDARQKPDIAAPGTEILAAQVRRSRRAVDGDDRNEHGEPATWPASSGSCSPRTRAHRRADERDHPAHRRAAAGRGLRLDERRGGGRLAEALRDDASRRRCGARTKERTEAPGLPVRQGRLPAADERRTASRCSSTAAWRTRTRTTSRPRSASPLTRSSDRPRLRLAHRPRPHRRSAAAHERPGRVARLRLPDGGAQPDAKEPRPRAARDRRASGTTPSTIAGRETTPGASRTRSPPAPRCSRPPARAAADRLRGRRPHARSRRPSVEARSRVSHRVSEDQLDIPLNKEFGKASSRWLATASADPDRLAQLTVIGPHKDHLDRLRKWWDDWLRRRERGQAEEGPRGA